MSKKTRSRKSTKQKQKKQQGLGVSGWIAGMVFAGYLGAELILVQKSHPLHWLVAALAGAMGFPIGQIARYWKR